MNQQELRNTQRPLLIYLILTNREHKIVQSGIIHTTLGDHSLVFCVMKGALPNLPPRKFEYRSFKNYNKMEVINDLNQVPWSVVDGVENVDDAVFLWERLFSEIANEHAPLRAEMKRDKDYHFRKARYTNTYHWEMYRKLRNYANHGEKNLKSKYFCQMIEDAKGDSCEMWRAIKQVLPGAKKSTVSSIFENGK